MKKNYFIWVLLALGVIAIGCVAASGTILTFIHIPSFILVVLVPAFVTIAAFGLRVSGRSFRIAFEKVAASRKELETGARLFKALQNCFFLMGIIAMMIGVIAMLAGMDNQDLIGPYLALALITLLYSIIFNLVVVIPFRCAIENRIGDLAESGKI